MTKPYELVHTGKMSRNLPSTYDVIYKDSFLPGLQGQVVGLIVKDPRRNEPWRAYWLANGKSVKHLLIAEYHVPGISGRNKAAQAVINFCLPSHAPVPLLSHEEIMTQFAKSPPLARRGATVSHLAPNGKDIYEIDWKNPWMDNSRNSAAVASKTIHLNRDAWKASL